MCFTVMGNHYRSCHCGTVSSEKLSLYRANDTSSFPLINSQCVWFHVQPSICTGSWLKQALLAFFCSSLHLLFLLISEFFPFESLQCVRYSCSSPPHKHGIFFGSLCSNSQGCTPANSLCVGVPGANYQLLTAREISRVEEALEVPRECSF